MSDRRRNSITWVKPPQPTPRGTAARPICLVCAVGDCDTRACVRVGCFHECPNPRRHGSAASAPRDTPRITTSNLGRRGTVRRVVEGANNGHVITEDER